MLFPGHVWKLPTLSDHPRHTHGTWCKEDQRWQGAMNATRQLHLTTSIWLFHSVVECFISKALTWSWHTQGTYIIIYETVPPSTLFPWGKDTEPEPLLCKQAAHLVGLWHLKGAVRIFQGGQVEIVSSCSLSLSLSLPTRACTHCF